MEPEIVEQLARLDQKIKNLESMIAAVRVEKQMVISRNEPINPGIASKVAYNRDGLITGSSKLTADDIPELPITKIRGLSEDLDNKVSIGELNRMNSRIAGMTKTDVGIQTGTKVTIDRNGHVIDIGKLVPDDIPELPATKIQGVRDVFDQIRDEMIKASMNKPANPHKIEPGTACKVRFDETGSIVDTDHLAIDDMPGELISKINNIQHDLQTTVTIDQYNKLTRELRTKLDSNKPIEGGTFTKVIVDSDGLVIGGSQLTKKDIPQLNVNDIVDLRSILNGKASTDDIIKLRASISTLSNSISSISSVNSIREEVGKKADASEVVRLRQEVSELREEVKKSNRLISELTQRLQSIK